MGLNVHLVLMAVSHATLKMTVLNAKMDTTMMEEYVLDANKTVLLAQNLHAYNVILTSIILTGSV